MRHLVLLLLVTLFLPQGVRSEVVPSEQGRKKIGVVIPLTGPMAHIGEMFRNTLVIVDEELDPKDRFEIIVEDDAFSPRNTLSAATKLLNEDKVSALIVFGSGGAIAVSSLAESKKIPLIAIAYSNKITANRSYVFRLSTTLEDSVDKLCGEIRRRKYGRVALVATAQEAMTALRVGISESCPESVVSSNEVHIGDQDLRTIVSLVKRSAPDAVALLTIPPQGAILARLLRTHGYTGDLFSGVSTAHRSEIKAAGGALVGGWVVAADLSHAGAFLEKYQARFGPLEATEGLSMYDAVGVLVYALEREGAETLRTLKSYNGVGGLLGVDQHQTFSVPLSVYRITESWFEPVHQ